MSIKAGILALSLILPLPMTVFAQPNLESQNYNTNNVEEFIVVIDDGEPVKHVPFLNSDGTVKLQCSLEKLTETGHTIKVEAINIWGKSETIEITFTKRKPDDPILRIVP